VTDDTTDDAKTRVLDAADALFYRNGIRAVGIDEVRDTSGVSLKRLYRLFPSKEHLAEAVLRRRDVNFQRALTEYIDRFDQPRARLLAVFDFLNDWFCEPDYRGCPFINAYGEMSSSAPFVARAVTDQKQAFHELLEQLAGEAGSPSGVADQLFILTNGAMVTAAVLGSPEPARQAQRAAELVIDANTDSAG
jgi:AcrR family transcriptional regulator